MVCLTHDYFSYMKLTIFTSVDSASSLVTDWNPMQKLLAGDFIRSLDPTSPNPTFTPEASLIVDQYIYCQQWLLRAGHPLSSTHNAHDDVGCSWTLQSILITSLPPNPTVLLPGGMFSIFSTQLHQVRATGRRKFSVTGRLGPLRELVENCLLGWNPL